MNFLTLIATNSSVGVSQRSLLEHLVEGFTNNDIICTADVLSADSCEWPGVATDEGNVVSIMWNKLKLKGTIDLQWLPAALEIFSVWMNDLEGTLDLSSLPKDLKSFNVQQNRFEGKVDLRSLPSGLAYFNVSNNLFAGEADFSKLPQSLNLVNVSFTGLKGVIPSNFEGDAYVSHSLVQKS